MKIVYPLFTPSHNLKKNNSFLNVDLQILANKEHFRKRIYKLFFRFYRKFSVSLFFFARFSGDR